MAVEGVHRLAPIPTRVVTGSVTPATPAARLGSIEVLSRPSGAQVVLDSRVEGQTPLVMREVPAGTHDIRVEAPGFNPWAICVHVTGGAGTRVGAWLEGNSTAHECRA